MRKVVMLAVAVTVVFAAPAALAATQEVSGQQQCTTTGGTSVGKNETDGAVNVHATNYGTSGGHIWVQSCDNSMPDGNVSIGGNSSGGGCLSLIVEGDADNGSSADDYVGVDYKNGAPHVFVPQVMPASGTYNHC